MLGLAGREDERIPSAGDVVLDRACLTVGAPDLRHARRCSRSLRVLDLRPAGERAEDRPASQVLDEDVDPGVRGDQIEAVLVLTTVGPG